MIQLIIEGGEVLLELGKVHNPATGIANIARQLDAHMKGVPMQTGTFVTLGDLRQAVGRLKMKFFVNFHKR